MNRILLVEDNPDDVELTLLAFERSKLTNVVTVARDGVEALAILHGSGDQPPQLPFALVLLDLKLPRIDGFEVLREIVRHDGDVGRVTGIIAVSGDATPVTCQMMLCAGADDFISRPFQNGEFALRVRRIAHRTRALRRALGYARLLEGHLRDGQQAD